MAVYKVDASGHAPKGATVNDYIETAGGTYQIVDGSRYAGMSKEQLAQAGVGYNPVSGLYSKKVSANASSPVTVGFNSNQWKESFINKLLGEMESNYDAETSRLKKTYNTNLDRFGGQIADVNRSYDAAIENLTKQTYLNNILAKQQASRQGLTSSGQGVAMAQGVINNANAQSVGLYKSKQQTIDDINRSINLLTSNYNIDKDSLKAQFNAKKLAAMSDAELQALDYQLKIETQNASAINDWNLTKYQTENANAQAEKDRELNKYLTLLGYQYRGGSGGGSRSSGSNSDKLNSKYEASLVDNYLAYIEQEYGSDWVEKMGSAGKKKLDDAVTKVEYGILSAEEFQSQVSSLINSHLSNKSTSKVKSKTGKNEPIPLSYYR